MARPASRLPSRLDRRFEAVIFDWDRTAVPDRLADTTRLSRRVEELCALGMEVAVVSGTHVDDIDGQLGARPPGPGSLYLLLNRGSEVFRVDERGVGLIDRRTATPEEDAALDTAAALLVERLARRGLESRIVSQGLNRRRIDLIPVPEWADPPTARKAALLAAVGERLRKSGVGDLKQAVRLAEKSARDAGLPIARVTSDAKHVEIGFTDKSDSARWMLADLWRRGISSGLVLIVGDETGSLGGLTGRDAYPPVAEADGATAVSVGVEPDGVPPGVAWLEANPGTLHGLLVDQLARRRAGDVPELGGDPGWTLAIDGIDPERERAHESLLALADGCIGTRGSPLGDHPAAAPLVIAAGVYRGEGTEIELQPGPLWNRLPIAIDSDWSVRRVLDLHTGLMRQELHSGAGSLRAMLFSSFDRPGTVVLRSQGPTAMLAGGPPLISPGADVAVEVEDGIDGDHHWMWAEGRPGGLGAAAAENLAGEGPSGRLNRIAAYRDGPRAAPARQEALAELEAAHQLGFERLLVAHRAAWARRWAAADIEIEGDAELQLAVRVALYHLMASVADTGEAAVGARGLTGSAYRGHVFWDSEIFVLPFLAATHPGAARAILQYRARRLPAARAAARAAGRAGARFAWESAVTGEDVTPASARDRAGRALEIHTGQLEEHVVADVAWATNHYLEWTGDEAFLSEAGASLLVETARFWASRIDFDADGRGHIRRVIGPDEYHVGIDDNAFTNVMARWNLRRAAGLDPAHASGISDAERCAWLAAAEALVDGYDADTGLYEQFAGFHSLEPLVIADVAPKRPIAADLLLGRERVESSQAVKQADVLMLHHLVPEEVAPGSLVPNLRFYEPRTAHASSLSPGIHAALLARAGQLDDAVDALRLTSRIDLDDLSETTGGGVHLAAMGSVWQALALGFAGVRPAGQALKVDPHLPPSWRRLGLGLRFRGSALHLEITHRGVEVVPEAPLAVRLGDGEPLMVGSEGAVLGGAPEREDVDA